MARYAAFLRGVSPMNAKMPALKRAFEATGFTQRLEPAAKRIVTFLRDEMRARLALPVELDGARLLAVRGKELFSAYLPSPKGAVFMTLIERTFGKEVTTRTWATVEKVAQA